MTASSHKAYIGRFAPSPTGPLHFGSLLAALASYLDARARNGRWLVRVEDLDPPREVPGATDAILRSLESHHLFWDGDILFQSQRDSAYSETLNRLDRAGLLYYCYCTRREVAAAGGVYPGTCRHRSMAGSGAGALRLKTTDLPSPYTRLEGPIEFEDVIVGHQQQDIAETTGDFIVRRKDGLFAYQLAVVVDDIAQGVTHVIRGSDLLHATAAQILLFRLLGASEPRYGHIPVAVNEQGQKLSKQQGASPLDDSRAGENLFRALRFLGQAVPDALQHASCPDLLRWGVANWDRGQIPRASSRPASA
ncbi:tRNA glutamyl-Q(34) synthetase GluQRS [Proteobacteria bacterium 005FR1]|nr:tRNA glutamyl-Q(34) synthetase GluQRS [Proteobacteria bacterium 005FR1]